MKPVYSDWKEPNSIWRRVRLGTVPSSAALGWFGDKDFQAAGHLPECSTCATHLLPLGQRGARWIHWMSQSVLLCAHLSRPPAPVATTPLRPSADIQFTRQFCEWPFLNSFLPPQTETLSPRAPLAFCPSRSNSLCLLLEQKGERGRNESSI